MKVILGLAATWGVPAKHGDIPNAYVKANKEEHLEILLHVPRGMKIKDENLKELGVSRASEVALELKKSLYGLKQAGRLWSQLLHTRLKESGFEECISDLWLYYKRDCDDMTVVGVYVDDFLVTETKAASVDWFLGAMESLSIKSLGEVSRFLGI